MTADLLLTALLRAQAAASLAIVLVLVLRGPARRLIGVELTYRLWATVPITAVISLFPTLSEYLARQNGLRFDPALLNLPHPALVLMGWVAGGAVLVGMMTFSEVCFRRLARQGRAGPAVMGTLWPRIVTPSDYADRFTPSERALIDRHERAHIERRDPQGNLFIAACQVVGWFNPLVHLAAACARLDQELACDAAVIQARPDCRRRYGETLVKAHMAAPRSPFACAWSARGAHPLEIRLRMLTRPTLTLPHYLRGAAAVGAVALMVATGVWALAPGGMAPPSFEWREIVPIAG